MRLIEAGFLMGLCASLVTAACSDDDDATVASATGGGQGGGTGGAGASGGPSGPGGGGEGGEGGEGGGITLSAQEYFEQHVKEPLIEECEVCHGAGQFGFVVLGDEYVAITHYRSPITSKSFIVPHPPQSQLLGYVDGGEHTGGDWPDGLREHIETWLELEASELVTNPTYRVGPVAVADGANVISLAPISDELEGYTLEFNAEDLGGVLELDELAIVPPAQQALYVEAPTFIVVVDGVELVDDSLSTVEQLFTPVATQLSTGNLLLTQWETGAELAIEFEAIEPLLSNDAGVIFDLCSAPNLFFEAVQAGGDDGFVACAESCHGGEDTDAQTAFDLAPLLLAEPGYARACAYTRAAVTIGAVASSPIVKVTDPDGDDDHPFDFDGDGAAHQAFVELVTPWIEAEEPEP